MCEIIFYVLAIRCTKIKSTGESMSEEATQQAEVKEEMTRDQDGAWKEILNEMFEEMLQLFFPKYHKKIDWSVPPQFLDNELQTLNATSDETLRLADKLAKVRFKGGEDKYLLIHVEVQGYADKKFARRMFIYYYRLFDKYEEQITSLAILTRPGSGQVENTFRARFMDGWLIYRFPIVKVWELRERAEHLRQSKNPFAHLMLAQLSDIYDKTPQARYSSKLRILRDAVDMGFERKIMVKLMRLTDWLLRLPKSLELQLSQVLTQERGGKVNYITSWEEIAMERGLEQGLERGLEQGLERGLEQGRWEATLEVTRLLLNERFGDITPETDQQLQNLSEVQLKSLTTALLRFESANDVTEWLKAQG
jgi:predicted transposase YdaD